MTGKTEPVIDRIHRLEAELSDLEALLQVLHSQTQRMRAGLDGLQLAISGQQELDGLENEQPHQETTDR